MTEYESSSGLWELLSDWRGFLGVTDGLCKSTNSTKFVTKVAYFHVQMLIWQCKANRRLSNKQREVDEAQRVKFKGGYRWLPDLLCHASWWGATFIRMFFPAAGGMRNWSTISCSRWPSFRCNSAWLREGMARPLLSSYCRLCWWIADRRLLLMNHLEQVWVYSRSSWPLLSICESIA